MGVLGSAVRCEGVGSWLKGAQLLPEKVNALGRAGVGEKEGRAERLSDLALPIEVSANHNHHAG